MFVVGLQLVLVFALELLFGEIEIQRDLFVLLELHDHERISSLALAERRIQPNAEHKVGVVGLREDHKLLDSLVLDLVVVRLAPETERGVVHVDVEPASAGLLEICGYASFRANGTNLGVRWRTSRKVAMVSPAVSPISAFSIRVS